MRPLFEQWLAPFRDLGVTTVTIRNTGGTDHLSFTRWGSRAFSSSRTGWNTGLRTTQRERLRSRRARRSDAGLSGDRQHRLRGREPGGALPRAKCRKRAPAAPPVARPEIMSGINPFVAFPIGWPTTSGPACLPDALLAALQRGRALIRVHRRRRLGDQHLDGALLRIGCTVFAIDRTPT